MKTLLKALLGITALVVVAAAAFIYSGVYDVSATEKHTALAKWIMTTTMHQSVKKRAVIYSPPDLSNDRQILAGASDYAAMCVGCHGAPGQSPEPIGKGLNPSPPDLGKSAKHLSAAELFWVTKHGIKMTGMPAWGATHDDASIWPVVAFMIKLPDMTADSYARLIQQAKGVGHHASDQNDPHSSDNQHENSDPHAHGGADMNTHSH